MEETLVYSEPPAVASLLARGLRPRRRPGTRADVLPDRVARLPRYRAPIERLAAYNRVCGFALTDAVPATWVHVLTFGLQTALLTEPDFPFAAGGLVHVSNRMTLHRAVGVTEHLDLLVRSGEVRTHPKGVAFDLLGEARVGGDLVWTGVSTYLARGAQRPGDAPGGDRADALEPTVSGGSRHLVASQQWRLSADLGRRYAAVSGDINPIHLSVPTARLFGYRRPIAHGMWTHARALAALGHLPGSYTVSVDFRRPILLPATVGFAASGDSFAVLARSGKELLTGTVAT